MAKTHVNGATNPFKLRRKTHVNGGENPCKWGENRLNRFKYLFICLLHLPTLDKHAQCSPVFNHTKTNIASRYFLLLQLP